MPASHRPRGEPSTGGDRPDYAEDDRYGYRSDRLGYDEDERPGRGERRRRGGPSGGDTPDAVSGGAGRERPVRSPASRRLTAITAGRAGLACMAELTGKDIEGVTLVKPAGDGWAVEVEVVEDHRIPSSGDTLAIYAIDLDSEGDLVAYRRVRSFKRASGDAGGVY
ncbi:gas vesicle protein [Sphaerisporangium melleum]|uniref:gas vesicle protein GvpO n=1 Tax=Sphaerisporangium melleum TaxID=321316 RepID=UPI001E316041|nr:gas vesicle protein [Sphaerisporangium melleum]